MELNNNTRHLNIVTKKTFNLMGVGIILRQDAYKIQRPLDYKMGRRSEFFAVLTELGWVVSGPMTGKKNQTFSFRFPRRSESGRKYPIMVGHRNLCLQNKSCRSIKEKPASSEVLRERNKVYRPAVRSGHALEWTRNQSSKKLRLGPGLALLSGTERRHQKDPNLKKCINSQLMQMLKKHFWRSWANRKSGALLERNDIFRIIQY